MATQSRRATNAPQSGPVYALHYTRISGAERQRDGYSLDAQLADIRRYSAGHGWAIEAEYSDVLSGKRDDRPGYQALLSNARSLRENGRSVRIVVKWLHRFGRNLIERVRTYEELQAIGAELHGVAEGGVLPAFVSHMLAAMAQEETRQLGERVADMAAYIQEHGWLPGRVPNWGYRWREPSPAEKALGAPRKVLGENPDEAPAVRELFARAAAGESARSLHKWAASLPLVARGGRTLGLSAVQAILNSPVYVARPGAKHASDGGAAVLDQRPGHWPALISDETWRQVKARQALARFVPPQSSGDFLLTGMLYCPECEGRMCGSWSKLSRARRAAAGPRAKQRAKRYRCFSTNGGARPSGQVSTCRRSVDGETLEADVMAQVQAAVSALLAMDPITEQLLHTRWHEAQREAEQPGAAAAVRRRTIETATGQLTAELAQAAHLLVTGVLDKAGYDALKATIDVRLANLDLSRQQLAPLVEPAGELPSLPELLVELGGWSRALAGATITARRGVLAVLVRRVVPVRSGYGTYTGSVEWTEMGGMLVAAAALATA